MNILLDLFVQFALLACVAFGGATALLPELFRVVVEQRHWMDAATFAHMYAIAQAAPGPNLLVVTLIGWKIAGLAGALLATAAFCLPMSAAVFFLFRHWDRFRGTTAQQAVQLAVAPLAVGLVLAGGWLIGAQSGAGWPGVALGAFSVAVMLTTRLHPLWLIGVGALLGMLGVV
jgi:chromate transporter